MRYNSSGIYHVLPDVFLKQILYFHHLCESSFLDHQGMGHAAACAIEDWRVAVVCRLSIIAMLSARR